MDFFNLHTHQFTNQETILELVNQYPNEFDVSIPYYSIGIHPWYINEERLNDDLQIIVNKLQNHNCLAIGECGLDKRIEVPIAVQEKVFETQLMLAQKNNKPVVIHCVAAFQEVITIKKRLKITVPMIIHGFSKNSQVAKELINNGFYISFGKYLLQNPEMETVFKTIPDNRFFLETDTISESIEAVYALAAQYKDTTIENLKTTLNDNFKRVFELNIL
ncbi:TatD family hydrolase [Flavobacterium adhaerens]|uniref:TatD family hydrolase n=1 Tax=Flavobacterium adhaerens TaxID=3149043 RepID=UPI0032B55AD7